MLPIDGIKIDRLSVTELPDSNIDQSIVAAVASLAQRSRFKLVAEGVETREQARFLIDQGVTSLQGSPGQQADPGNGHAGTLATEER
jgi:EAL domain-containing protein (putative c-di-GMP-specific phosphodiesterase class I)